VKPLSLRFTYILVFAASIIYAGAGNYPASLLSLATALAVASIVERFLHVVEAVSVLLHLACVAASAAASYLYSDAWIRAYAVICAVAPLATYVAFRHEEERA